MPGFLGVAKAWITTIFFSVKELEVGISRMHFPCIEMGDGLAGSGYIVVHFLYVDKKHVVDFFPDCESDDLTVWRLL